jgi:hypothetical protein
MTFGRPEIFSINASDGCGRCGGNSRAKSLRVKQGFLQQWKKAFGYINISCQKSCRKWSALTGKWKTWWIVFFRTTTCIHAVHAFSLYTYFYTYIHTYIGKAVENTYMHTRKGCTYVAYVKSSLPAQLTARYLEHNRIFLLRSIITKHDFCVIPCRTTQCNTVWIDPNFSCMVLYDTVQQKIMFCVNTPLLSLCLLNNGRFLIDHRWKKVTPSTQLIYVAEIILCPRMLGPCFSSPESALFMPSKALMHFKSQV